MMNQMQPKRILIFFTVMILIYSVFSLNPGGENQNVFLDNAFAEEGADADDETGNTDEAVEEGRLSEEEKKQIEDDALKRVIGASKIELEGLEQKRKDLIKKEEELQLFEARLESYKGEIQEQIETLEAIHKQIEASLAKLNEKETEIETQRKLEEEAKIKQLVSVYSGMKPKNAGAILDKMDTELAFKILQVMKGVTAGKILAYVDSQKAAEISERLALDKIKK